MYRLQTISVSHMGTGKSELNNDLWSALQDFSQLPISSQAEEHGENILHNLLVQLQHKHSSGATTLTGGRAQYNLTDVPFALLINTDVQWFPGIRMIISGHSL